MLYISRNLKYLRAKAGLNTTEMAGIGNGIDPLDVFLLEIGEGGYPEEDALVLLVAIADYFTVQLGDLFYEDLERKKAVNGYFFNQLKREFRTGKPADRKAFNEEVVKIQMTSSKKGPTRLSVAKSMLNSIHRKRHVNRVYFPRPKDGHGNKTDRFGEKNTGF